ncbi:hypothetical protein EF909_36695 [Streptomyces sp. WAC01280]|nr:hypothetical protein EF909_36695 [Streptomyces sp. WAC01280]
MSRRGAVGVETANARRPEGSSTIAVSTPTEAPRRRTEPQKTQQEAPRRRSPHGSTVGALPISPGADSPHGIRAGRLPASAVAARVGRGAVCRGTYGRAAQSSPVHVPRPTLA